ncbi:hypothetical protein ES703_82279 [subsurface metagenome]
MLVKHCKLERCGAEFETTRDWKDFCCRNHQQEYWGLINKERRAVLRRLTKLEESMKEFKESMEKFRATMEEIGKATKKLQEERKNGRI